VSVVLTGHAILAERRRGALTIEPFDPASVNPNSYNFHLHPVLLEVARTSLRQTRRVIPKRGIVLRPGRVYLGATQELIGSGDYVVTLLGISSVGRLGIFLNITADLGHLGCHSRWTLEIAVVQPVRVYPGMGIGQVAFWRPASPPRRRYRGRYLHHTRPEANRDSALLRPTP
jgi:dCTP deaminase